MNVTSHWVSINFNGENINHIAEKYDKHYLNQVIKMPVSN